MALEVDIRVVLFLKLLQLFHHQHHNALRENNRPLNPFELIIITIRFPFQINAMVSPINSPSIECGKLMEINNNRFSDRFIHRGPLFIVVILQ